MTNNFPALHRNWLPAMAACVTLFAVAPVVAQGPGRGPGPASGLAAPVLPLPEDQAKTLQHMREEEKLAHDVYQQLYEKWQLTAFKNIAASEEVHFRAVGNLIARYGIVDPAAAGTAGVFADPALAALYKQLIDKGSLSVKDALEVGVLIEKTDIADLEKAIAASDRVDIKRVYTNLMNASYSHLDAFETNLELACNLGL